MVAERRNIAVDNDDKAQTITMPASLPYGKYTITVWGNMDNEESLGDGSTDADMEASGTATNDIYLASGTFDYRYGNEAHTIGLERTKGNLLIKAEGLPDNIDFSTKNIDGVYTKDPKIHSDAVRLDKITYDEIISGRLGVIDLTAATFGLENKMKIVLFGLSDPANIYRAITGESIGTLLTV